MVHMEYRVGLRPNRATVVGDDSSWERMLLGSFVPGDETSTLSFPGTNFYCVVVSFPGTKVLSNIRSHERLTVVPVYPSRSECAVRRSPAVKAWCKKDFYTVVKVYPLNIMVTGHFGPETVWHSDTSALFRWVRTPKCLDISAPVQICPNDTSDI